jgi:hypothetical protein
MNPAAHPPQRSASATTATASEPAPSTSLGRSEPTKSSGAARGAKPDKSGAPESALDRFLGRLVDFFSSLRLTVFCLVLASILVFLGTLAQVDLGLYQAQNDFFRSFFIFWGPKGASWKIPVFPGGYSVGGVLLINLLAAHAMRFKFTRAKAGIWVIHVGIILLLLGQLGTDMLSRESHMKLFEGESRNFSESSRDNEFVLIDKSSPQNDLVYAIPERLVLSRGELRDGRVPLTLKVVRQWVNAALVRPSGTTPPMAQPSGATAGDLKDVLVIPSAPVTDPDSRNTPAAVVEVRDGSQSLGSFLVSVLLNGNQELTAGGKTYEIGLRAARVYYPFSLTLLKATHEQYKGTDTPKNFASRVRVENPARNEARETVIYMNNPLRYSGLTFYQYQMTAGEIAEQAGATPSSTFMVVHNPSWLTPYLSCILVGLGLVIQFGTHLIKFLKRRTA